jgi:hypothetical protein
MSYMILYVPSMKVPLLPDAHVWGRGADLRTLGPGTAKTQGRVGPRRA